MKKSLLIVCALITMLICTPAGASTIYTNGAINGSINAWLFPKIYTFSVADSFVSSGPAVVSGFDAGIWVKPGDTPTAFNWTILTGGPSWLGGTTVASGQATCSAAYWGASSSPITLTYDIYTATVSGLNVLIGAGTYWLELSNGLTADVSDIFWDENDGPSAAYSKIGPIGSEAFTVYGAPVPLPSAVLLLGSGLIPLAWARRKNGRPGVF